MEKYFSIPQAAKTCSVSRSTMHRWVVSGKIKSHRTPGGHNRILHQDLKKWMEDNQIPYDLNKAVSDKIKILIVDDEESIRNYLKTILSGLFVKIDMAVDGFEAGKKIVQFNPDLVILDLFMPSMSGFDVCKKIKSDPSTNKIKILILSGHLNDENRSNALLSGADDVLQKPSSKKEILDCVEKLLKRNT